VTPGVEAFFLSSADGFPGERYALHHLPPVGTPVRRGLVYLHPWAEEMNKARRMAAIQSRELAKRGIAVLQIDLLGCGDSGGDFGDASWDAWLDDARLARQWLIATHQVPVGFWGLRAGCLLAAEAARAASEPVDLLFWQPVISGKAHLGQFLRLSSVAELLADRFADKQGPGARAALAAGASIEVAGYRLAPALAQGLERAELAPPAQALHGLWIEIDPREEGEPSPATRNALQRWQPVHRQALHLTRVRGPAFWQTQEIEDAPELIHATVNGIAAWAAP
jgi:exosortase A-associated hydrolase 2